MEKLNIYRFFNQSSCGWYKITLSLQKHQQAAAPFMNMYGFKSLRYNQELYQTFLPEQKKGTELSEITRIFRRVGS